jgi:hypothetical protein
MVLVPFRRKTSPVTYTLASGVLEKARKMGMYGDPDGVVMRLQSLARLAIPFHHALGNRRYKEWLFKIEGNVIKDLVQLTADGAVRDDRRTYRERRYDVSPDGKKNHE